MYVGAERSNIGADRFNFPGNRLLHVCIFTNPTMIMSVFAFESGPSIYNGTIRAGSLPNSTDLSGDTTTGEPILFNGVGFGRW